jgi:putative transposase
MSKFKDKYRIETNRWEFWDYSAPGDYYITICVKDRLEVLGKVVESKMINSPLGDIVAKHILDLPKYHQRVVLHEWTIMPDHIHLIITLRDYDFDNGFLSNPIAEIVSPKCDLKTLSVEEYRKYRRKMLLFKLLGKMQQQSAKEINILQNTQGESFWQRGFFDRVIRNIGEFERITLYIKLNSEKWERDRNNEDGILR